MDRRLVLAGAGCRSSRVAVVETSPIARNVNQFKAYLGWSPPQFLVPAPSERVRAAIKGARAREMERPSHAREVADAPLGLLQAQWSQVLEAASLLGIAPRERPTDYEPG